jgi:iron complex outermembrane recepter protein
MTSSTLKRTVHFVSALAITTAIALPAYAQEATEEEQTGAIRDIIVTAQKRDENIQDVPIAVTAIDEQRLANPL